MDKYYILGFLLLIAVVSLVPLLVLYMSRKRQDEYLTRFYSACNKLRDDIHTASSRAEVIELFDDVISVEESFIDLVPHAVLDKEIKLLDTLLNKKSKKIK